MLALFFLFFTYVHADNWAVLVAGSNGFYNYRHQADVCHAYKTLTEEGGFREENIIVMMYDDIAASKENPFPGQVFNGVNGTGGNVYPGTDKIDYKGETCTADTFLSILNGTATKALKSTEDDNVFIYYTDHGAVGLVGMPVGEPLYATDLLSTFDYMYEKKMYKEMVVYIEACESGSMLQNLTTRKVYGTTAATGEESSYACYWDDDIKTYLGDEYSVSWLEDSDRDFSKQGRESLHTQYENVVGNVNESHPQEFGEKLKMGGEDIMNFQEESRAKLDSSFLSHMQSLLHVINPRQKPIIVEPSMIQQNDDKPKTVQDDNSKIIRVSDSRDVRLNTLRNRLELCKSSEEYLRYMRLVKDEVNYRQKIDIEFAEIAARFASNKEDINSMLNTLISNDIDFACTQKLHHAYELQCRKWTDYSLKYMKLFANLCSLVESDDVVTSMRKTCRED